MADVTLWEYRVLTLGGMLGGLKDEDVEAALNELGAEGWEVIRAEVPEQGVRWKVVAKRPLTEAQQSRRSWPGS